MRKVIRKWSRARGSSLCAAVALALAACGSPPPPIDTAGRLVLAIDSATSPETGRRCDLAVTASNDTGAGALNVQAAWMAHTEGFGIISDYQFLGDFVAGETRAMRLTIEGAPCSAVRELKLTRAVCVIAPSEDPPRSCADLVLLDGRGIVKVTQ